MQKNYFPAKNQTFTYLQTNRSDDLGSIWSSMGLDFQSNLGTMRVAPRLKIGTSTTDDAQLGLPVAFEMADSSGLNGNFLWAICGGSVFKSNSSPNAIFTEDASAGAVTTYTTTSDLEVFDGRLWSTAPSALYSKVLNGAGTGAWTARGGGLTPGPEHMLVNFSKFNKLYYQGANGVIYSITAGNTESTSGPYTLDLGTGNAIGCMKATSTYIWAGVSVTSTSTTLPAVVYQWDGISAQPTNKFLLKSRYVNSMTVLDDIPYVMDGNGVLSKFTGASFEEVGRLPFTTILPVSTYVHRNGMIPTKNGTILVVVNSLNGDNAGSVNENVPSGVWEWSEEFGFTHKYAFTYNPSATSTITDYGQNRISAAGAIFDASNINQGVSGANGTLLVGATYFTNASSTQSAIFLDDSNNTVQKKGYYVTTWFLSNEIENHWSRLWAQFRRLLSASDSVVFKYRVTEEEPAYADITWVNTTSFTTATNVSAYGPTATGFNGTQGGEVEVIQGTGSASCAHITDITGAGPYTVTLDTAITGVTTGTAKARFQKWIKLNPASEPAQAKSYLQAAIAANEIRFQLKGCLTFTGNGEFYQAVIAGNEDIKVTL